MSRNVRPLAVCTSRETDPTVAQIQYALRDECDSARCPAVVEAGFHGNPIVNNCPPRCVFRESGGVIVRVAQQVRSPEGAHVGSQLQLT